MKDIETAVKIAKLAGEAGGRAYYVGGFVRDRLLGTESKDIDIEIHGIEEERLVQVLKGAGEVFLKGKGFPVYGIAGTDIDIALPRRDVKTGPGHRGFEAVPDPFIGEKEGCERRDFTVNAMMEDILTGEILDFYGGREDLKRKRLRHVSRNAFAQDPLRVLRMAQFAARFSFTPDDETLQLGREAELSELPGERVFAELEKALLKSEKPSVFFEVLRKAGGLSFWFKEIEKLIGCMQSPVHHPEGDVWNHTMLVLDAAAGLRDRAQYPAGFMISALMHDIGKPETTFTDEEGRIRSIGHENCSRTLETALGRITGERKLKKYVYNMVRLHMRPNSLAAFGSKQKAINRLFDSSVSPRDLLLLAEADHMGRPDPSDYTATREYLYKGLERFEDIMGAPFVTGQDLIDAGVKPGDELGSMLRQAHSMRLSGMDREAVLKNLGVYKSRTR